MKDFQKVNMLVSFADLTNFARFSEKNDLSQLAEFVSEFYDLIGEIIEPDGGEVIKFLGDAALIVFPEDRVNQGIESLMTCKQKTDKWLRDKGVNSQLVIKTHFGEMIYGKFGTKTKLINDVIGKNVNIAALIKASGFAMTPQVFRKLNPDVRKLFKKHTPPVTYIPVSEYHRD